MLRIMLKNQCYVNVEGGKFVIPKQNNLVSVFACTDGLSCWLDDVETIEELNELISEKNIATTLRASASDVEYEILDAVLSANGGKYMSYDNVTILTSDEY